MMAVICGCGGRKPSPDPAVQVPVQMIQGVPWVPLAQAMALFGSPMVEGYSGQFHFQQGTLDFKPNHQSFTMVDQKIWMGYACLDWDGTLMVHRRDWEKCLLPLLRMKPMFSAYHSTIVLDPGHGGRDTGAMNASKSLIEKELTLKISRLLQANLAAKGWLVHLTRESDLTLDIEPRISRVQEFKPDFFISLHVNSAQAKEAVGIETFYTTPQGLPSNLTRNYEDPAEVTFPANQFDDESFQLAWSVQRHLLIATGAPDRGVKKARFMGVLRNQSCPAILVETGFLSNPDECQKLASDEYLLQLASGIASAFPDRSNKQSDPE